MNNRHVYITTRQDEKYSSRCELSADHYLFAAKTIFTQWNMKVVLLSYTVLVQINCIPVELCVCVKKTFNSVLFGITQTGVYSASQNVISVTYFSKRYRFLEY